MTREYGQDRTDAQLVEEARDAAAGDLRAFGELVRRHETTVKTNCRYMSGSVTDAEDLAQDVFVKAYFGLKRFEGRASFQTWIKRIKANHCINFVKKRARRSFRDVDDPGVQGSDELRVEPVGDSALEGASRRERIRIALESIPAGMRIPLILRDMDGLSYHDIAREMGIGLSAAKMRVKRGREAFRERYVEDDEPEAER
jgi:RNA polymerase sigma-70 factor (ECF subfamily)